MRDTDSDWRKIADADPYFGVLTHDRFSRSNLTQQTRDEFYASGEHNMAHVVAELKSCLDDDFAPTRALDFGCGVGRLTLAMAAYANEVVGLDVAPGMLKEAEAERDARGISSVSFSTSMPDGPFDWISSIIVFQHIPPPRGLQLLDEMLARLAPRGVISLHFPLYRERRSEHLLPPLEEALYFRYSGDQLTVLKENPHDVANASVLGRMRTYDYDLTAIVARLFEVGISRPTLIQAEQDGWQGARIYGRRLVEQG